MSKENFTSSPQQHRGQPSGRISHSVKDVALKRERKRERGKIDIKLLTRPLSNALFCVVLRTHKSLTMPRCNREKEKAYFARETFGLQQVVRHKAMNRLVTEQKFCLKMTCISGRTVPSRKVGDDKLDFL